jgi:hypothetical protein
VLEVACGRTDKTRLPVALRVHRRGPLRKRAPAKLLENLCSKRTEVRRALMAARTQTHLSRGLVLPVSGPGLEGSAFAFTAGVCGS